MKRFKVISVAMVAIAFAMMAFFTGCGDSSTIAQPTLYLQGITQMYSYADHPRIAVLQEVKKGVIVMVTSAEIVPPTTDGWVDVPFMVELPSNPTSSGVYFLRLFNDTDGDGKWSPSNEGDYKPGPGLSYDGLLWHYQNANGTVIPGDATKINYYFASANGEV